MAKTTTIRIDPKTKVRLESIGRYGEAHSKIIDILLFHFAFPKKGAGGLYATRTILPAFSKEEVTAIEKHLMETMPK